MQLRQYQTRFESVRRRAVLAAAATMLTSLAAFPALGLAAEDGKPVVVARDMDFNSLDPARAFCDTCQIYLSSVYDRLVDLSPDNKSIVPMLAKEWSARSSSQPAP